MKASKTQTAIHVIPSAKRLMKSLRDVGYNFSSAVADIVDNSIEAGATHININVVFDGNESWVSIVDNGKGMSSDQIIEAMRYGSERKYKEEDLGKFGLGLKTASLSQCRILSVASKSKSNKKTCAYCWDLNHIEQTDKWQILPIKGKQWLSIACDPLKKNTGTVVLWRQLDRFLGYKQPYGDSAKSRMVAMCRELEQHLSMVFHRFLSGEIKNGTKVLMLINGNVIRPWDPFAKEEKKTQSLTNVIIDIENEGVKGKVLIEPFILPPQQEFSSMAAFKLAAGPANWNLQQGFYIYRANRLIQSGGWCRLRAPDEHTKLARVAVSFSPSLDDAFKINVAKMNVQIPSAYRDAFDQAIQPAIKLAQERYRKKDSGKLGQSVSKPAHFTEESGANTQQSKPTNDQSIKDKVQSSWTLEELEEKMLEVASLTEKHIIRRIFSRLREKIEADKKHE